MSVFMKRKSRRASPNSSLSSNPARPIVPGGDRSALDEAGRLYNRGHLVEARRICEGIITSQPDNHKAVLLWAMIEHRGGDFGTAIRLAKHAIQLKPDYADALVNLGAIYRDLQQPELARESLENGLLLDPNHFLGHMILANLCVTRHDLDRAEQALRRAIEINPNHPDAHNTFGSLMELRWRMPEAEEAYRQALASNPNHVKARCNLSRIHNFVPGDPEIEALNGHLTHENLSLKDRIGLKFALGWAYDRTSDYQTAFGYLREANAEMASISPYDETEQQQQVSDIMMSYADLPAWPIPLTSRSDQVPIFIIGPSRSGKSLIESFLARHDGVLALGEGKELLQTLDKCFSDQGLTKNFRQEMGLVNQDQLREIGLAYRHLMAQHDPDVHFLVNTLAAHYQYVGIILDALPGARVIICQREAMDCCMRIYFNYYATGNPHSYDQGALVRYYATYWRLLNFWRQRYGERILHIRYEDLVVTPQQTLPKIFHYCGLGEMPSLVDVSLNTQEIGHWRNYGPDLTPMQETLHEMARVHSLPDLLPSQLGSAGLDDMGPCHPNAPQGE
jgi:tetratricopeptide (TPR) repeat protein